MRLEDITNRIVSGSATVIAIVAMATAVYQAKLMRDQAKASVWPYLLVGNAGIDGYSRIVQNVGLGPAVVKAFEVRIRGTPVHSWKEAAESLHVQLSAKGSTTTSFGVGIVAPVNSTIELVTFPDSGDIALMRKHQGEIVTWVCYCSLYGDCWTTGDAGYEPRPARSCHADPEREFER